MRARNLTQLGLWRNGFEFPKRSGVPPSSLEVQCPASGAGVDDDYEVLIKSSDNVLARIWEHYSDEVLCSIVAPSSALNIRRTIEGLCRGAGITTTGQLLEEMDTT